MSVNEAGWDRIARIVLAVVLAVIGLVVLDGTAGVIVGVLALVPLLTGLIGWCPLYQVFGVCTLKNRPGAPTH